MMSDAERVALTVSPSLSAVMKSAERTPESLEMESMVMEVAGAVVSLFVLSEACVAELPARSATSAVMVRLPSLRVVLERTVREIQVGDGIAVAGNGGCGVDGGGSIGDSDGNGLSVFCTGGGSGEEDGAAFCWIEEAIATVVDGDGVGWSGGIDDDGL